MNKQEVIQKIAEKTGLTKVDSKKALEAALDAITTTLQSGKSVNLVGFGSLTVKNNPARSGRNPRTGDAISIKASKGVKFTAGKVLREALN